MERYLQICRLLNYFVVAKSSLHDKRFPIWAHGFSMSLMAIQTMLNYRLIEFCLGMLWGTSLAPSAVGLETPFFLLLICQRNYSTGREKHSSVSQSPH